MWLPTGTLRPAFLLAQPCPPSCAEICGLLFLPLDCFMPRHSLEARLLTRVARAIRRVKTAETSTPAPTEGSSETNSSWWSLGRNVGLVLPDLLIFQKRLEIWILK